MGFKPYRGPVEIEKLADATIAGLAIEGAQLARIEVDGHPAIEIRMGDSVETVKLPCLYTERVLVEMVWLTYRRMVLNLAMDRFHHKGRPLRGPEHHH